MVALYLALNVLYLYVFPIEELAKIDDGYDIASGWRKNRLDNAVTRKFPSRIANWLMAKDVT